MVRRNQNRGKNPSKRPAATLDLQAEDLSSENLENEEHPSSIDRDEGIGEDGVKEEGSVGDEALASKEADSLNEAQSQSKTDAQPENEDEEAVSGAAPELTSEQITELVMSQRPSGSFFKTLMAALIGGVIALGGQQFMPRLVTSGDLETTESLRDQVGLLEEKINKLSSGAGIRLDAGPGVGPDIGLLANSLEALTKKVDAGADAALTSRVDQVEKTLVDMAKIAVNGKGNEKQIAGVAAIATKLNKIEVRVDAELTAIKTDFAKNLRREMEQLSKAVAEQESLTQLEGVKLKATTLSKRLAALDAQSSKLVRDMAGVTKIVDDVKSSAISSSHLSQELVPLQASLKLIDEKIAQLVKREAEALESSRRSALAIAFSNLKRGMDRGEGFAAELQAVQKLAGSDVDFSALVPIRDSGVPTEQVLLKRFPKLAIEALSQDLVTEESSGWQKIMTKARTAFRYRRTGQVEGETSEAVLARMEHKFKEGHVEDVLTEAKALGGKAKTVLSPWLKQVEARLLVETEMQKLEDQLLRSLSPKT